MEKRRSFFILIAILIGIGLGILAWIIFTPKLAKGVFYYRVDGDKAKLFLIKGVDEEEIISLPAREVNIGKYKPPSHSYISYDGQQLIYFKQIDEVPIETPDQGSDIIISRIVYEPTLVNLKTGKEKKINQPIDSSSLVFSFNDAQIAWIKRLEESTYQDIEKSGKKRELWISRADGENAQLLVGLDENVVLLKLWQGDYIYFQGLWDVSMKSIGRINVRTKKVDYLVPRYCEKFLENCRNIEFFPSGRYFIYEIYSKEDDKEITELYLGDFEKGEFQPVLTTDRISDRLWFNSETKIFYTEQETAKDGELEEKIHLVDIKNRTDDIIYIGSYVSQLTISPLDKYLYFLEKEKEGENFKLVRLDLKIKEAKTILTEDYNKILLLQ